MSFWVYILHSESLQKYYVGETEDLEIRLKQHLEGFFEKSFTATAKDWVLFHKIQCESRSQGLKIEKHIKRMKSSTHIQNLKKYQDIELKLKKIYK
ncbi:GIY-YIG nuclease family protein [Salegentibacter sp. HM20]